MSKILKHDTDGNKPLLGKGELGYDDYAAGGDAGRVYVGTGTKNIALADLESVAISKVSVNQVGHGFSVLDAVAINGSGDYVKAQADAVGTLAIGLVTEVSGVDDFVVGQSGSIKVTGHGLTVGSVYYLDETTAGALTETAPNLRQEALYVVDVDTLLLGLGLPEDKTASNVPVGTITDITGTDVQAVLEELAGNMLTSDDLGTDIQAYDADTAKTDTAQTWSAPQRSAFVTENTLSFDLDSGQNFKGIPTATANISFSNLADGQSGVIWLINVGDYIITKGPEVLLDADVLSTISTTGIYVLGYDCDGTSVAITSSKSLV